MPNKLTDKQELFLELLFDKNIKSPKEAAELAGYSGNLSQIFQSKALSEAVLEKSQSFTAMHAPKAIMSLIDLLDNPNKLGAANIVSASKELLDRGGLVKKDKLQVDTTVKTAVVMLPELDEE